MSRISKEILKLRSTLNDLVSRDDINLTDIETVKLSMKLDELINSYLNISKVVEYRKLA